ncbi:MAG TPA: ribosome biogenesis GTPase Der [Gammaproteobacteria bacterium]|nr:GTPase Der [bacterium BMS3Abin11]HDH07945.1 ribosome biogenesis GTPase Der [Gammaproteobacteria bacterium]HDH16635.1 ribosome biogenesis GTPase Der [Gammaproteobacteria bacterium]HDZ78478.1 ribosome biogenesis GTPase Der [Gammaproteobacteria bacterium]
MKPVIALVGQPNVGKSTLFNRMTRSRDALVDDQPGITRDRIYGNARYHDRSFIIIDTGGLDDGTDPLQSIMSKQSWDAADEADAIIFIVDGRAGLSSLDDRILVRLRKLDKRVSLAVNKTEGLDTDQLMSDFYALGLGEPLPISSAHGHGVSVLMSKVLGGFPESSDKDEGSGPVIAVIGRPNAGKSTLINALLGEQRVVVFDRPGTTRDSIRIPFEREGKDYTLIDTAGVRRRGKVDEKIEKFSVIKTLQAIDQANVVLMMLDAQREISDQDATLASYAIEQGKAMVVIVNKWDGLSPDKRLRIKDDINRKLIFLQFAELIYISALHGTAVGNIFPAVERAYDAAMKDLPTSFLTRIMEKAIEKTPPPMISGRRMKPKFAHQGGHNPPVIVIHGNQLNKLPGSYRRYLINTFRKAAKLQGTPIRLEMRAGVNPYERRSSGRSKKPGKKH